MANASLLAAQAKALEHVTYAAFAIRDLDMTDPQSISKLIAARHELGMAVSILSANVTEPVITRKVVISERDAITVPQYNILETLALGGPVASIVAMAATPGATTRDFLGLADLLLIEDVNGADSFDAAAWYITRHGREVLEKIPSPTPPAKREQSLTKTQRGVLALLTQRDGMFSTTQILEAYPETTPEELADLAHQKFVTDHFTLNGKPCEITDLDFSITDLGREVLARVS